VSGARLHCEMVAYFYSLSGLNDLGLDTSKTAYFVYVVSRLLFRSPLLHRPSTMAGPRLQWLSLHTIAPITHIMYLSIPFLQHNNNKFHHCSSDTSLVLHNNLHHTISTIGPTLEKPTPITTTQPTTISSTNQIQIQKRVLRSRAKFLMTGSLPTKSVPGGECGICTDPMEEDIVKVLACNYSFHCTCVLAWFKDGQAKRNCTYPMCRRELYKAKPARKLAQPPDDSVFGAMDEVNHMMLTTGVFLNMVVAFVALSILSSFLLYEASPPAPTAPQSRVEQHVSTSVDAREDYRSFMEATSHYELYLGNRRLRCKMTLIFLDTVRRRPSTIRRLLSTIQHHLLSSPQRRPHASNHLFAILDHRDPDPQSQHTLLHCHPMTTARQMTCAHFSHLHHLFVSTWPAQLTHPSLLPFSRSHLLASVQRARPTHLRRQRTLLPHRVTRLQLRRSLILHHRRTHSSLLTCTHLVRRCMRRYPLDRCRRRTPPLHQAHPSALMVRVRRGLILHHRRIHRLHTFRASRRMSHNLPHTLGNGRC
jgi:hypothetical protein